jgi:hypothetical protein
LLEAEGLSSDVSKGVLVDRRHGDDGGKKARSCLVHVLEQLDHRCLLKIVQDQNGSHNIVKGVRKRSNNGHDSQLIIEVVESKGR